MAFLVAIGALLAAIVAGVVLYVLDFEVLGIVVFLASLPAALAAWMTYGDRHY